MFSASLVKLGPRKGVFEGLADVLEKKAMRLFRDWLAQLCSKKASPHDPNDADNGAIIWVDENSKTASLDVGVKELRWSRDMPILVGRDEEQPVTYSVEFKGQ